MALKAVFFDVGETLVDEERFWRLLAERAGVARTCSGPLSAPRSSGARSTPKLWARLGIERPQEWDELTYTRDDLYPDAIPCLEALQAAGFYVGVVGNQTTALEQWARTELLPVDYISSSASWGVRKPAAAFFERVVETAGCAAGEVAYVGDRVDNDVAPAAAAGLVACPPPARPLGMLQHADSLAALSVDSLAELPIALASLG